MLVTVCAVACSWLAVRLLQLERQRQAIAAVEKSGGYVFYDYQISRYVLIDSPDWENPPPGPKWLRDLLGDDFFARVVVAQSIRGEVTDSDLEPIKQLSDLRMLEIGDTGVTDDAVGILKGLTKLEYLGIGGTKITESSERALQQVLPKCQISRDRPYHPGSTRNSSADYRK